MDTVVTRAPHPPRRSWRGLVAAIALVVAVLIAFVAVDGLVQDPTTAPTITVRNQTDDLVDVLVRTDDGSLLPIALVDPKRRAPAHDIVDQGDRWTFVVRVSDDVVATIRLSRAQLERADWTVTVTDPTPGG